MSIYGRSLFAIQESYVELEETVLTQEEAIELQESVIDILLDLHESNNEELDEDEFVEEGANLEMRAAFKAGKKKYKEAMKEAKKAMKDKDYTKAKAKAKEMKQGVSEMEIAIKKQESTIGSDIFGFFANGLLICMELFVPMCIYGVGVAGVATGTKSLLRDIRKYQKIAAIPASIFAASVPVALTGYVTTLVKAIVIIIKDIIQLIDNFKNGDRTEDALNLYRNKLLVYCKDFNKQIDKFITLIDKKEKLEK